MSGGPVGAHSEMIAQEGGDRVAARKPTILMVTEDPEPSQAISAWLREAGLRVGCPDPQPPSYLVPGTRRIMPVRRWCRRGRSRLWLASDTMLRGTPAMQHLSYYPDLG